MNLLPQASGARPRVACEITSQGIVAARAESATAPMAATSRVMLAEGAVQPSLRPGNLVDRLAVVTALRRALEELGLRANSRSVSVTLVVPDSAVRVLLLEFDALPPKLTEALPLVRFRLKKMLPFDADTAMISYQIMKASRGLVRTLAVAMPRDVLNEYESALREAGFEPGAVLPSTLAALAGVDDSGPRLVVNASETGVTAAIVDETLVLLHRSVDLQTRAHPLPPDLPPALFQGPAEGAALPLVSVDDTEAEWAAQEALPEHGRNPYADRAADEAAVEDEDRITQMRVPPVAAQMPAAQAPLSPDALPGELFVGGHADVVHAEAAPVTHSPYADPATLAEMYPETHNSILLAPSAMPNTMPATHAMPAAPITVTPTTMRAFAEEIAHDPAFAAGAVLPTQPEPLHTMTPSERDRELAEAVSVAAAYFEDTLGRAPRQLVSAGPLGAEALRGVLGRSGLGEQDGLDVVEAVGSAQLLADAVSTPRSWLAGVAGALRG